MCFCWRQELCRSLPPSPADNGVPLLPTRRRAHPQPSPQEQTKLAMAPRLSSVGVARNTTAKRVIQGTLRPTHIHIFITKSKKKHVVLGRRRPIDGFIPILKTMIFCRCFSSSSNQPRPALAREALRCSAEPNCSYPSRGLRFVLCGWLVAKCLSSSTSAYM